MHEEHEAQGSALSSANGKVDTEGRDLETVEKVLIPVEPRVPDPRDARIESLRVQHVQHMTRIRELQGRAFEIVSRIELMNQERVDLEQNIRQEIAVFSSEEQILKDLGAIPVVGKG